MKKLVFSLLLATTSLAFAAGPGKGGCSGVHQGKKVSFSAYMSDIDYLENLTGGVFVDGRQVATFTGYDVNLSLLSRSFRMANGQGDIAEGKLSNPIRKTGVMSRLYVPAYGIDFRDIKMSCWFQT
ncbi:hypothetical protein [Peredibacter starrii]|uniref:Uncharacterized protein n=1 Tax=Peredibacter starrii TaxID=28202 RepID=A0AAX4HJ10_9BACT|nr:hypothetical protein [Peredibacter starrii]WPU63228.1 hypothetical protein SOO65_11085 [Peredibacter starrii]